MIRHPPGTTTLERTAPSGADGQALARRVGRPKRREAAAMEIRTGLGSNGPEPEAGT